MSLTVDDLRQATDDYDVVQTPEGFVLAPKAERREAFNRIVRRAMDHEGSNFAAFPIGDGAGGYEGLLIIPIAC